MGFPTFHVCEWEGCCWDPLEFSNGKIEIKSRAWKGRLFFHTVLFHTIQWRMYFKNMNTSRGRWRNLNQSRFNVTENGFLPVTCPFLDLTHFKLRIEKFCLKIIFFLLFRNRAGLHTYDGCVPHLIFFTHQKFTFDATRNRYFESKASNFTSVSKSWWSDLRLKN